MESVFRVSLQQSWALPVEISSITSNPSELSVSSSLSLESLELLPIILAIFECVAIAVTHVNYKLIWRRAYTKTVPVMLALCSMFSGTYYAQNYAGIITKCTKMMLFR